MPQQGRTWTQIMEEERRFPRPFEIEPIPGTEGWERMYPYFYIFGPERKEWDEQQLWFYDKMHYPDPMYPLDLITGTWQLALSGYTTRIFAIPPANGITHRILNGYFYITPQATPPEEIGERVPLFQKRTGFYYEKWDELYETDWVPKMEALIKELKAIEFNDLPKFEPESTVLEHKGYSSGYVFLENFHKLVLSMHKCWQYHFEFLNLVYLAYVMFYDFCVKAFPDIHPNTIAKMVAGAPGVLMFQPDVELTKLARLATYLGIGDIFKKELPPEETIAELEKTDQGKRWLEAMEIAKDPWFYTSSGPGFFHYHRCWLDDLSVPFAGVKTYIERLERGDRIERRVEEVIAERQRLQTEYRALLPTDEDKKTFDQSYQTLAMCYPYAENHIFYVEHYYQSIWWNKARDLGKVLANAGFLNDPEDIFLFYYHDIEPMLLDLTYTWAVGPGTPARGPGYWAKEVEWRKAMMKKFREWTAPPALGVTPEVITEPFTIQLWGITSETLGGWLAPRPKPEEVTELKGFPASAGVAEGLARVIIDVDELGQLQPGEILVCLCTSPSWTPAFAKIKAIATDLGGMSCHASIVAREYGVPCVSGTAYATSTIKTGDKIKVDGTTGVVTIMR